MGKNPFLVELSLQGDVLRKMPLNGWNNPEGVAVMENGLMAVVDERDHSLTVVKVDASTTALNKADFPSHDLGPSKTRTKPLKPSPGTSVTSNWCWAKSARRPCSPGKAMATR